MAGAPPVGFERLTATVRDPTGTRLGVRGQLATMGYACPVCEVPQPDGEHLANHLAFTAMLRGEDHEAWLDEHVPDWGDRSPADLAPAVTDRADEATYDAVFEDTADRAGHGHHQHDHAHEPGRPDVDVPSAAGRDGDAAIDAGTRRVVEEAREMTRRMRADDGDQDASDEAGDSSDGAEGTSNDAGDRADDGGSAADRA